MINLNKTLFEATTLLLSLLVFKTCSLNTKSIFGVAINPDEIAIITALDIEAHSQNKGKTYVPDEGSKRNPVITCAADVNITCADDYQNLNIVGEATAIGSDGSMAVEYNDIITRLSVCNEGFIKRRWIVVGVTSVFCDQFITITEAIGAQTTVNFDQVYDKEFSNCLDQNDLGEPTWIGGSCDVIGYSTETDTFFFEDGACIKLVITYTVINWCDYNPGSPWWVETDDFTDGLASHTQIVKMKDQTQPLIADCDDILIEINDHDDIDNDGNVCEAKIVLTNSATDPGSENCPSGWLKWQVFVDLWGDGTDDLEFNSFLPPFDSQFNDTNGNGIPDIYLAPTESGEEVSISLPDIEGSLSFHKVRWKVNDGCYNVTTCNYEILVLDRKGPTPFCIDSTSVELDEYGNGGTLWATDFNIGSFDNCSSDEDLRYTFSDIEPEDDPLYDDSRNSSYRVFDYSDAWNSPVKVNMYVWDEKDNYNICAVYVVVNYQNEASSSTSLNTGISTSLNTGISTSLNTGISTSLNTGISTNFELNEIALKSDQLENPHLANKLYQNIPNPFRDITTIGFDLASSTNVTLTIINSIGATITTINIDGKQGYNTYQLDNTVLGNNGLYYYKLECEGFMEIKKMIMVR